MPGGIDAHVHMETPMGGGIETCDTFETGTLSAAFGGTTTIIDFAQQFKGEGPKQALDRRLAAAEPQCCVDYGFHVILTDVSPSALSELPDLVNNEGVSSFKLYMAYPDVLMVDDADIYRTMRKVGDHGGMVNLHAENGVVIQALIEEALAARQRVTEIPSIDTAAIDGGRSHSSRDSNCRAGGGASLYRAPFGQGVPGSRCRST